MNLVVTSLICVFLGCANASPFLGLFDFANFLGVNNPATQPPPSNTKFHSGLSKMGLVGVVGFNNNECLAKDGGKGMCTTSPMCKQLSGIFSGNCADGFGVCCVVQRICQGSITTNSTYFVNPGYPNSYSSNGQCGVTLHRVQPNICQMRLDFEMFTISQPDVSEHRCTFDRMEITGAVTQVPPICGDNPGQHMYLHIGFGKTPVKINIMTSQPLGQQFPPNRNWKILVTQIPCDYTQAGLLTEKGAQLAAPPGCLQYFTGTTGTIKSFNFNFDTFSPTSTRQLSNQDYTICLRQEENFCGVKYQACRDPVNSPIGLGFFVGPGAGASGVDGNCVADYITIPCASDTFGSAVNLGGGAPSVCAQRLCGSVFSSISGRNIPSPVFSTSAPFEIRYHTDNVEASATPSEQGNLGFCLTYDLMPCTAPVGGFP